MQVYASGYLGQHSDISTSFRALSGSEAQTSLVPGGWGCFGLIRDGSLHLHAAQPRVSQQQLGPGTGAARKCILVGQQTNAVQACNTA